MHKYAMIAILSAVLAVGCAARSPIAPDVGQDGVRPVQEARAIYDERYRLWGEWIWHIPETHDRVDLVPRRDSRVHLNVLKWLEEDCGNCLEITNIKNNGDSTIDLTVRIRHPKPGHPEFTGFDVKGIIMFNGSLELPSAKPLPPYPEPYRISWRGMGDPDVLNADGYTLRWSPWYSGSSNPLLSYWPGKYSSGTPTANLNAFLNFYTDEDRHMFTCNGIVSRTYHIYLPPGPLVAGYAVEACWVAPEKTPVTDPASDFPFSANQDEPYHFDLVINNNEPITHHPCCGFDQDDECKDMHVEVLQWGGVSVSILVTQMPPPDYGQGHNLQDDCQEDDPPHWYGIDPLECSFYPDGYYRGVVVVERGYDENWQIVRDRIAYDLFDWTVDLED
jgi:hypothetical protein